ncbi:hypothetical protein ACWEV4_29625 [Streptomyces sp. NPDC003860]
MRPNVDLSTDLPIARTLTTPAENAEATSTKHTCVACERPSHPNY